MALRIQFDPMPAYARDVTIRHLLTHTSGLPAYEDFVPRGQTEQVKDRDVLTLIQRALKEVGQTADTELTVVVQGARTLYPGEQRSCSR